MDLNNNLDRSKLKPGIDIEIIGTLAVIRICTGKMPPAKAHEHASRFSTFFDHDVKRAMGVTHCLFVPYPKND